MAIIWQHQHLGRRYEVRTAGYSTRLYKDGVLHSQFNERSPVTGQVWDLLMLPAFFYSTHAIRRVLVLGVGGGTVIRQLEHFIKPVQIVGVDLDNIHLTIAKRFFGLNKKNVSLHCDNALHWLTHYDGKPFDMIIEDIFSEEDGEPIRATPADAAWARCILKNLTSHGLATLNFISAKEAKQSAFVSLPSLNAKLQSSFLLNTKRNANVVGAFLKTTTSPQNLKKNLNAIPLLDQRKKTSRLRYRIIQLK